MAQKIPIIIVGNGLTSEIMCSALDYFNLEHIRLLPQKSSFADIRTTTINVASQKMLSRLNLWSFSEDERTEITKIIVSNNKFKANCFDGATNSCELSFSLGDRPMAWTIHNNKLLELCRTQNINNSVPIEIYEGPLSFSYNDEGVKITDISGRQWQSTLLIACDGANSQARKAAGLLTKSMAANQKAIVAEINLNRLHNNIAFQRFLPDGPLAFMPVSTEGAALVWSLSSRVANMIYELSDTEFESQLINALGDAFQDISLCSQRSMWTLRPSITRNMGQPGLILAGDSNHSIHPLAGMGFNLALGDIAVICDCLVSAKENGLSFSHASILEEYRAKRRIEVEAMIGVTQGLNRLFSYNSFQSKILPSSLVNIGLSIMDVLPIKQQIAQIASGGVLTTANLFTDI